MSSFQFRRGDKIGYNDAADDERFLRECYVETGLSEILLDCQRPERIVLGRTGAGKTALIKRIAETNARSVTIEPENLALSHISNSNILQFFESIGVKLDVFYKLLWRHTICIEILKARFGSGADDLTWFEKVRKAVDRRFKKAVEYLERWGESFWESTEERVKEITTTIENELRGSVKGKVAAAELSVEGARKLSEQSKKELRARAQTVVNQAHVRELKEVLSLVDYVLPDSMKPVYVLIDRLDEQWVFESVRIKLIMALVENVREFRAVRHAKVIIALREDLLESVYALAKPVGFQEEKVASIALRVQWTREQIEALVESRLNELIRHRYQPKERVKCHDIISRAGQRGNRQSGLEYMIDRTLLRPRDIIAFLNMSIERADGKPKLPFKVVADAEGDYSASRLKALEEEWVSHFPSLGWVIRKLLHGRARFRLGDIESGHLEEIFLSFAVEVPITKDRSDMAEEIRRAASGNVGVGEVFRRLLAFYYRVSAVGLRLEDSGRFYWSHCDQRSIASAELHDATLVTVHPMLRSAIGC